MTDTRDASRSTAEATDETADEPAVAQATAATAVSPGTLAAGPTDAELAAAAERRFARTLGIVLPAVTIGGAIFLGIFSTIGPAILVLATGVLLGVVSLFWASLRTLLGDAPLPEGLDAVTRRTVIDRLDERKRTALRALKDLEHEHEVGKIDDADYADLASQYRNDAKSVLREIDERIAPRRARAEKIARDHLAARGLVGAAKGTSPAAPPKTSPATEATADAKATDATATAENAATDRRVCPKCATSNEADATFCKRCGTGLSADVASSSAAEPADA